jgi:hypothetical protein
VDTALLNELGTAIRVFLKFVIMEDHMNRKLFGFFILASLVLPVTARANPMGTSPASPAWEFTSVGSNLVNNLSLGEVFTVNQTITVDYLGYFYDSTTGMSDSHSVVMYDAYGNPLASTIITSASLTDLQGNFKFNDITPITLIAGDTYVLDGASGGYDPYAWSDPGFTVYAPITIKGGNTITNLGTSADFSGLIPTYTSFDGLWGADFGYTETPPPPTIPEPSSFLLLGSGLAGLAGLIKRKLMA